MVATGREKSDEGPIDLEIKDAELIFKTIWSQLEEKFPRPRLIFPKEIIWLGGAPGAGKGTNTPFIEKERGFTSKPVVVSSLLVLLRLVLQLVKKKSSRHLLLLTSVMTLSPN